MHTLVLGAAGLDVGELPGHLYVLQYEVYGTSIYDATTSRAVQGFRRDTWGDPGSESCEAYTFEAIKAHAAERRVDADAPVPIDSPGPASTAHVTRSTTHVVRNHDGSVRAHVTPRGSTVRG